ncbi:helix-turn-helix transcriptional regulator [Leifsonia poae]|uniref:HTH luxR-type domain-containing protein n=1 Tax=Leifsonia poae TaxID=110933 RepID=A0A9W6H724_9MICO|nr:helix-turn-helix transcriptional regulator [Leifsonia poae]GLJ74842.1 hypothetical protein GCM10017584_04150 [Leifsonia poae]
MAVDERVPAAGPPEAVTDRATDRAAPDDSAADTQRWLREMGALLALPALWVDHEPPEIATGLLSVLFGMLRLEGAYVRFDDPRAEHPLELWRPSGEQPPAELVGAFDEDDVPASGVTTCVVRLPARGVLSVVSVRLALPWESARVSVSARRDGFPTEMETHLLRVAVSQAAIAIHTARRLATEHGARAEAEELLLRQNEVLRTLVDDVEPSLAAMARRVREASRLVAELDAASGSRPSGRVAGAVATAAPGDPAGRAPARTALLRLTPRELEVLGLLAQGLSNKEIAGVMWLSDRTVERHITSLYRKIGVARRSEATAFALRHGVG